MVCSDSFRIWHYSGALLYERPWNKQEELWDVQWQSFPVGTFKTAPVSYKAVEGIKSSQPTGNFLWFLRIYSTMREIQFVREIREEIIVLTLLSYFCFSNSLDFLTYFLIFFF